MTDQILANFDRSGVRAVRFNWIRHLLSKNPLSEKQRLYDAAELMQRIAPLGWHVEVHIDISDLDLLRRLHAPQGMTLVVDHMARIDTSATDTSIQLANALELLENESFWVKTSGADRLALHCETLEDAGDAMRKILKAAPGRCVWGLDWPHVNLARKRSDVDLLNLLLEIVGDAQTLERVLIHNPAKLYGFESET